MSAPPLNFAAFVMNTTSHILHGAWRAPDAQQHRFNDLDHWIGLAKTLEEARFDYIFFADVVGLYDDYQGDWKKFVDSGLQIPSNDPLVLASAIASHTEHLGIAITSSILQEHPFDFTRKISTLDHLSKGRIAWNIVTSLSDNAWRNFGYDGITKHDDRYAWADEYVDVAYKLWEGSWDDGALVQDKQSGIHGDFDRVHKINHIGPRYQVEGPHLVSPSPQRTPVLFQAGSSPAGRRFAARNAEAQFILSPSPEAARALIDDTRRLAVEAGRDPIVAHILRAHYWFVEQVQRLPEGPQRARWTERIAAGAVIGNASSERSGAAGDRQYTTRLVPEGDGWLLSGEKFYSTGTAFADYVSVLAVVSDASSPRLAKVVVPVDRPGVAIVDDWDGIGQHRTGTGTTLLHDVAVSPEDVLEFLPVDAGGRPTPNDGPLLQLYLQALIAGILLSVSDDAVQLLTSRTRTFEHAPATDPRRDPVLLERIGELDATAHAARDGVLSAARHVETANALARRGVVDPDLFGQASVSAARVKVHVDRIALPAAAALFDVGGASSASRSRNLDRHWRNIRTITLHNPTSYKAVALGDLRVNGRALPDNGYF